MAISLTGISPPAGSLSAAPIACDGFALENTITLGLWLDRSIIVPISGYRRVGRHPTFNAIRFSLHSGQGTNQTKIK